MIPKKFQKTKYLVKDSKLLSELENVRVNIIIEKNF